MESPAPNAAPTPPDGHVPVLLEEVVAHLEAGPGMTLVDATLGLGGHSAALLPKLAPGGTLVGLDVDPTNLAMAGDRLSPLAAEHGVTLHLAQSNFRHAKDVLASLGLTQADRLLADLGFASTQVDNAQRGLAFSQDGPLDMRLDPSGPTVAADLVNDLPERDLADLIWGYGEEKLSRAIARKIVAARADSPIRTTRQLAELVTRAYGPKRAGQSRIHPATRTFQALRIAVNDELGVLDQLLAELPALLAPGGRAAVISFHSLEDRRVKQAFAQAAQDGGMTRVTRKPLTASATEAQANPRSRSAKLRVIAKDPQGP